MRWNQTDNIQWSIKLPGWGTSSPVVYGGRVFVTSEIEDDGEKSLLTLCFDREDGRELWRHDFGFGVDQRTHEKSNLAVNTPAVTEDAVYVAFGNADIARYSHDGKLIWVNRYIPIFGDPKMAWGYGLSPLVLDDAVLFPWDHHKGLTKRMKDQSGPMLDNGLYGLIADMDQRGMLEDTLVVVVGEFGRSPQKGVSTSGNGNSADGRDHWPYCYTAVVAGAGIKRGFVYGKSDKTASGPLTAPVHPTDLLATIYHSMGIEPEQIIYNHLNQPRELVQPEHGVVSGIFT